MSSLTNYKAVIRYDGTRYHGWQRQDKPERTKSLPNGNFDDSPKSELWDEADNMLRLNMKNDGTIQGKLEILLSRICNETIEIDGSGRTDAGVHANGQVFNFHSGCGLDSGYLLKEMNKYLPEDIVVCSVEIVPERFHSRLWAKEKTYIYRIWNSGIPPVFERRYVYHLEQELDLDAMKAAAEYLIGTHNFLAFSSLKRNADGTGAKKKKSTVRTVTSIEIEKTGEEIRLTYTGDGFLYHMVRIMTGTIIEAGLHERQPESVTEIFDSLDRSLAGYLVPAKGLCLERVKYEI